MQTLAGIDTTQVYREFGFDFDQFKDLKLKQYFVHNDVVNWFGEILANKFREFNFIKIIYERLHHFDIKHVKCVEIYYDKHDLERFRDFKSEMDQVIHIAQYKMPWISDTIYYDRRERVSLFGLKYITTLGANVGKFVFPHNHASVSMDKDPKYYLTKPVLF